jgi:hypothetical protein
MSQADGLEVHNALITGTMLGIEDHGIFTCALSLEWDGYGCSFGGYALDEFIKSENARFGTGMGLEFIRQIMNTVGVEHWEQLKGKHIRVAQNASFSMDGIAGIGNLMKDEWFFPKKWLKEKYNEGDG